MKKIFKEHLLIILFLSFYFLVISFKLISYPTPFFDWDEAINAQVGREMIQNKSLVPLWQGKVWLDKPPLILLFYGVVPKLFPFVAPEVSTRIVTLAVTIVVLFFIYAIYLKVDRFLAFLTVVITSFIPFFLQRSQILNLDVFLLLGWLGYLLFMRNFYLSLLFLFISVQSKSLIGFYPLGIISIFYIYLLITKKITLDTFKKNIFKMIVQVGIVSIWYLLMFLFFSQAFWQQHIIETHFRRVMSSIESHFGKRTYYLDLIFEQFGWMAWGSFVGLGYVILKSFQNFKKNNDKNNILYSFFLFPWFIFLNLTKTKIFWYLYPAIPQFAFFTVYPLLLLHKFKPFLYLLGGAIVVFIFYNNFIKLDFFSTKYSGYYDHYYLAKYANDKCDKLLVLVGQDTRKDFATLEKMNLLIASSKWWGNHPSIVYYFGKKVDFYYNKDEFEKNIVNLQKRDCIAFAKDDLNFEINKSEIKNFNSLFLIKKD